MAHEISDAVVVRHRGVVTELVLNRPQTVNAIDGELALGLKQSLDQVALDPSCRCLVITGAGRGFCSGQALPSGEGSDALPDDIGQLVRERYIPIVSRIRELPVPVIAAVNGPAAGAGFSLALAADLRVASDAAWFSCAFSKIGLVPDSGASFFLAHFLGFSKALELAMTGERLTAAESLRLGLVARVFPADEFEAGYRAFSEELAQGATAALALTKRAFNRALGTNLARQMEVEAELQQQASTTEDFREGVLAFSEKRTPRFRGH